jgi:hypothetical protein
VPAGRSPFLSARKIRTFDVLVVVWIVAWVILGVLLGRAIWDIGRLTDPIVSNADGLTHAAEGFHRLSGIPLVGSAVNSVVGQVTGAAHSARSQALTVKTRIEQVGVAAGLLLALGPTLLVLLFYLPLRLPWRRDVAAIRRALAADPDDPVLLRYLAERAIEGMRYDRLQQLSDDPWRDMARGETDRLAEAELRRLGLRRARTGVAARL